jgi:hypothetical protein
LFYLGVFDDDFQLVVPAVDKRLVDVPLLTVTAHGINGASADTDFL